jgi:hypothetical protein
MIFLSGFMKVEFSQQVFEKKETSNIIVFFIIKIRPVGSELFRADQQIDGQT